MTRIMDESDRNGLQTGSRYFSKTLAKGLQILCQFDEGTTWLSLSELAARTGLDKATTLRLAGTLHSLGYLDRSLTTRQYRPGLRVLTLGHAALAASNLRDRARPHLEQLAEDTQETVNMGVLVGTQVLYIERIKKAQLVEANIQVGSTLPTYCTSMGKVLLAWLDTAAAAEHIPPELERLGPKTIVDHDMLIAELAQVRERGWARQDQEMAPSLRSVAAAIRNESGDVIAAVNIAVAVDRVTMEGLIDKCLPLLLKCVTVISGLSGFRV